MSKMAALPYHIAHIVMDNSPCDCGHPNCSGGKPGRYYFFICFDIGGRPDKVLWMSRS